MKKTLFLTLTLFIVTLSALDQNAHAEEPAVRPAEAVERSERKPGFFDRLFKKRREGGRNEPSTASTPPTKKAIATEASEIEETPKPTKPRRPKPTPRTAPPDDSAESSQTNSRLSPSPGLEATPDTANSGVNTKDLANLVPPPKSTTTPGPEPEIIAESTPEKQDKPDPAQLMQPIPFVSPPETEKSVSSPTPDLLDPEYVKRMNERYKDVRSKALTDKKVSALRDEADGAFEPTKRAEALKVYYEALFRKMREIDPSLERRIDGREKATMRRIESLTPVE